MKKVVLILLSLFLLLNCQAAVAETPPAGDDLFTVPNIIPAESAGDFTGEWSVYCLVSSDGSVTYLQSDSFTMKQQLALTAVLPIFCFSKTEATVKTLVPDEEKPITTEFIPEDGTLKVLTETGEVILFLNDNGMLSNQFQNEDGTEMTIYYKSY